MIKIEPSSTGEKQQLGTASEPSAMLLMLSIVPNLSSQTDFQINIPRFLRLLLFNFNVNVCLETDHFTHLMSMDAQLRQAMFFD
jgi:hypothetical protein